MLIVERMLYGGFGRLESRKVTSEDWEIPFSMLCPRAFLRSANTNHYPNGNGVGTFHTIFVQRGESFYHGDNSFPFFRRLSGKGRGTHDLWTRTWTSEGSR
jgi:hypothetical protein